MAGNPEQRSAGRSLVAPAVVFLLSAAAGGWLLQQGVDRAENVYVRVRVLQEVVDRVAESFVEEVDERSLYNSAIDGLIRDLGDPHTSLIPASAYEDLRIRTEGEYGGVGLEVSDRNGYVTVISPIAGGPAERMGVRSGDQFYSIGGVRVDTVATDRAVELLRGRPGTEVSVEMLRPGVEGPIEFTIERAAIRLRAVPFAVMLEGGVGYMPLLTVRETASSEMVAAIASLRGEGLRALVLDLRGNPGGLLDEGIAVTDLFLEEGQVIVETRGRARNQNDTFRAGSPDRYPELPVVVLVDGASASAAEIVAGALQDHDRAAVIGETTFGKGSVQSLFRLTGGDVLRLTTARWYTPAGRSIQLDSVTQAEAAPAGPHVLSLSGQAVLPTKVEGRPEYRTDAGRVVYGGGGITPDLFVAPETLSPDEIEGVRRLIPRFGRVTVALFNHAVEYVRRNPELEPGFRISDAELDEFYGSLPEEARGSPADFDRARRFVRYQMEREIALQAWGEVGQFQQSLQYDRQLQRALEVLEGVRSPQDLLRSVEAAEPDPALPALP
ncbi:MAG TPA: S41 family peptidase [Longimicrobiales bacterium]|nr:S41 family peptidase [Longimicrobiales bacterium]